MKRRLVALLLAAMALDCPATTAGPTPPPVRPNAGAGAGASPGASAGIAPASPLTPAAEPPAGPVAKPVPVSMASPDKAKAAAARPGVVWLHPKTNTYRCPGDTQYGQGSDGLFLKETEVEQNGARPQLGKRCW